MVYSQKSIIFADLRYIKEGEVIGLYSGVLSQRIGYSNTDYDV